MLTRRELVQGLAGVVLSGLLATESQYPTLSEEYFPSKARARAEWLSTRYERRRDDITQEVYARQDAEHRPRDFEEVFEIGERELKRLPNWAVDFEIPQGIGRDLYDLHFDSPITLASFKEDLGVISVWLRMGLGGGAIKTVMPLERKGNDRPRIQEAILNGQYGLINAVGLPGPGIEKRVNEVEQSNIFSFGKPIGISIGGNSLDEYIIAFNKLERSLSRIPEAKYYYEINISCPNTPEGQNMINHPDILIKLLDYMRHMRQRTKAVIGVKLTPDMDDNKLRLFADIVKSYERTYLNIGNTSFKKCEEVRLAANCTSIDGGGYSGALLYPRTLEMSRIIAPTGVPFIATGGVNSAYGIKELLDNGAALVGMATQIGKNPYIVPLVNLELAGF